MKHIKWDKKQDLFTVIFGHFRSSGNDRFYFQALTLLYLIFALGFENCTFSFPSVFILNSIYSYSTYLYNNNLSGGGEPHNVIEDGHRESTASLANRSGIMAEKKHQLTALGIAYEAVIKLGYTHSKLARLDSSINYPTLRNIREGKEMKNATERFYLKLFFNLINKEYERRMANGGVGAGSLLIVMKNILEAELK